VPKLVAAMAILFILLDRDWSGIIEIRVLLYCVPRRLSVELIRVWAVLYTKTSVLEN